MSRILVICDQPGWAVDFQTDLLMRGLPQYQWTKIFHVDTSADMLNQHLNSVDIVYAANWDVGPKYASILRSRKTVVTFRSHRYNQDALNFLSTAAAITTVNRRLKDDLLHFGFTAEFIPDCIHPIFKPTRVPTIGFVGVIDDHKGFVLVRAAVESLGFNFKVATFRLFGGQIPQQDMPKFYESCDAIVVASVSEGANTILLEAMAMNRPVLTTNTGLAEDLDCLIVDRSIESIKKALLRMFGRSQVLPWLSPEDMCARFAAIFDKVA